MILEITQTKGWVIQPNLGIKPNQKEGYKCIECEIETIKECYLECEDCGEYTCEGNGECIDCGSEKLKEILEVNV